MGVSGGKLAEYSSRGDAQSRTLTLRRGNMVVAPKVDTVVETAFGTVTVAAKSMALIMAMPSGTAVFTSMTAANMPSPCKSARPK